MVSPTTPEAAPDETVTLRTAFVVMQRFLEAYWERGGRPTDSLSDLLSSSSFLRDGGTADPAILRDWLRVAESVRSGQLGPIMLQLKKPE
jgi:hypothetical protein